jgi:hypothetical protein
MTKPSAASALWKFSNEIEDNEISAEIPKTQKILFMPFFISYRPCMMCITLI